MECRRYCGWVPRCKCPIRIQRPRIPLKLALEARAAHRGPQASECNWQIESWNCEAFLSFASILGRFSRSDLWVFFGKFRSVGKEKIDTRRLWLIMEPLLRSIPLGLKNMIMSTDVSDLRSSCAALDLHFSTSLLFGQVCDARVKAETPDHSHSIPYSRVLSFEVVLPNIEILSFLACKVKSDVLSYCEFSSSFETW